MILDNLTVNVSHFYDNGLGINGDKKKSFDYILVFKICYVRKFNRKNNIGCCYRDGEGVQKAVTWYKKL